jgi:ubiquinone/menaquinone biosynthesis C-methylase UbiE
MSSSTEASKTDKWKDWLLTHRHGGNLESRRAHIEHMTKIRERLFKNADLKGGETILDVGTGEGIVGFGALDTPGTHVIFSDISEPLVDLCREIATETGVADRCQFIVTDAVDLSAIPDSSVDIVTTRSVLIYVAEKQKALNEFFRVLKPGGRIALFEPVAQIYNLFGKGLYHGADVRPIRPLFEKIQKAHDLEARTSTMSDFDDRDLVRMALDASFEHVKVETEIEAGMAMYPPTPDGMPSRWETFYNSSPNPLVPTLRAQVEAALNPGEQQEFVAYLQPLIDQGRFFHSMALAWLTAQKADAQEKTS